MSKRILFTMVACLLLSSCAKPDNDSARTFFDFVCRDCNYLQVTEYHSPIQIGRTEPSRPQMLSSAWVASFFYVLELVPWSSESRPEETDVYSPEWRCEGDPKVEQSILQYYRKEQVRSFEHIEYRKEGLSNIEIFSSMPWVVLTGGFENVSTIEAGESLNGLFDVVRIYNDWEQGYDNLLIGKDGVVISALPDRTPLTEYLQSETKAFHKLCLFLKEDVGYPSRLTIRITLDDGRSFEYKNF